MAPPLIIRVRLDLRKLKESFRPSLVWLSVDTSLIRTIEDLKRLIIKRINVFDTNDVNLYCQDCYLPSDERIEVIRDEDLIRIHYQEGHLGIEEKCDCNSSTWFVENMCKLSHKRKHFKDSLDQSKEENTKKRKHNDGAADSSSHNDIKNRQDEVVGIHNDVELKNSLQKQSKKKKKHELAEQNSRSGIPKSINSISDAKAISDVLSSHSIDTDSCPVIRKKKQEKTTECSNSTISVDSKPMKSCVDTFQPTDMKVCTKTSTIDKKIFDTSKLNSALSQPERTDKSPSNNCKKKRKRSRKRKNKSNENVSINRLDFEKSDTDTVDKQYLDSRSNLGLQLYSPPIQANKHVKFTDGEQMYKEVSNSVYKESLDEKCADQNSCQVLPFSDDVSLIVTSSPLETAISNSCTVAVSPKREDSENSTNPRLNNVELVTNIQNRFKEFSKERQFASINTNISTIYINKQQIETFNGEKKSNFPAEKKDYKKYPVLKGPPRTGDLIAYKILELSEDYCPQMSDYKEGKVVSYNDEADDIEVELSNTEATGTRSRGKFDLPSAVNDPTEGSVDENKVIVNWAAMVEPRLLS